MRAAIPMWVRLLPGLVLSIVLLGCSPSKSPPNVILITMDTTRPDHLGCYGCEVASTPALDSLSLRSTLFEDAYTAAPITLAAHTTMLTGRTPIGHGIRDNGWHGLAAGVVTLPEVLSAQGYTTAAFVSAYVVKSIYDVGRGFETFGEAFSYERPASATTDSVIAYLERTPAAPLFLWVHYFDPHDPYEPPEPFASSTRGGPYDAEISAMDHGIGRLLCALDRLGYARDAHIIVVADHGEGLEERQGYKSHGLVLYDEAMRVPLLWHTPGQRVGRRDDSLVGCVDIYPTVLDVLGIDPPGRSEGISLRRQLSGKGARPRDGLYGGTVATFTYFGWSPLYGWITKSHKYIAASEPEFYDLEEDPGELHNGIVENSTLAQSYRHRLREYMDRWSSGVQRTTGPPSEQERASLEMLGYIQTRGSEAIVGGDGIPKLDDMRGLPSPRTHLAAFELFADIRAKRRSRRWRVVIEDCREVLKKLPGTSAVSLDMAEALLWLGRPEEALVWVRQRPERRSPSLRALRTRGDVLLATGHYEAAASAYARLPRKSRDTRLLLAHAGLGIVRGDARQARRALDPLKRALGRSPQAEIRRVQVARMKQLLFETDFPLKRIADLTGFEHIEYMSVVFKRLVGVSPGAYRTRMKSGD